MKKIIIFLFALVFLFGSVNSQIITVTSPDGGENWDLGSTHNVTWTSNGVTGNVGIKLFQNGSSIGYVAENISVSDGTYSWTISNVIGVGPISAGSNYQIQVKQSGVAGDLSDGNFTIGKPGPQPVCSIKITSPCAPGNSVTLWGNTSKNIVWDPSFSPGGNVKITMTYANCPGESGPVFLILFIISPSTPNDGNFSWTTPNVKGVKCYKITISKIGKKCYGRTGIIKMRPKLLVFRKVLSPVAIKLKYKKHISPLAKMIVKREPIGKIKLKLNAFLKDYISKTKGAGAKADQAALKALQEQVQKEIWEQERAKAEEMLQSQKEHIKKVMEMIKEIMKIQSEMIRQITHY